MRPTIQKQQKSISSYPAKGKTCTDFIHQINLYQLQLTQKIILKFNVEVYLVVYDVSPFWM